MVLLRLNSLSHKTAVCLRGFVGAGKLHCDRKKNHASPAAATVILILKEVEVSCVEDDKGAGEMIHSLLLTTLPLT